MIKLSLNPDEVFEFIEKLPRYKEDRTGSRTWTMIRELCNKYNLKDPNELIDAILVLGNLDSSIPRCLTQGFTLEQLSLLYICRATREQLYAWADMLENKSQSYKSDIVWNLVRWSSRPEMFGVEGVQWGDFWGYLSHCVTNPFSMKSLLYVAARVGFPKRALAHYVIRSKFWLDSKFNNWKPQDRDLGPGEFELRCIRMGSNMWDEYLLRILRHVRKYFDFDYSDCKVDSDTNTVRARVVIH